MVSDDAPPATAPVATAATVVLLRDGDDGPETLIVRRPSDRGSFAGAWVFPGGAVDADDAVAGADPGGEDAARNAAVRELREETALELGPDALVPFSRWHPPEGAPKRLVTWFFAAPAPAGELRLHAEELVDAAWLPPAEVLERHAAGALTLFPPTWVTLHRLRGQPSTAAALDALRGDGVPAFHGRFRADRTAIYWSDDAAYPGPDPASDEPDGPRHRLLMDGLPWRYLAP